MQDKQHILVVDDEENILSALKGILVDEGYQVSTADNGVEALKKVSRNSPDLVILDIWLPKKDGIETLKSLKKIDPQIKVLVMSGHGNIDTAVTATKLGAIDFIEKPFSLDAVLVAVSRALFPQESKEEEEEKRKTQIRRGINNYSGRLRQQTLKQSVVLCGQGLHSGLKTGMILSPLPVNTGIIFGDISTGKKIPAHLDYVESTDYATSLKKDTRQVRTIEHLMAVLHMYRISNLLIKIGEEVPIMDGSAQEFCRLIESGKIIPQDEFVNELVINRPFKIEDPLQKEKFISIEPDDNFGVEYSLNNAPPIGKLRFTYEYQGRDDFKKEISPARTYGFLKDYEKLEGMGLASGGKLSNLILLDAGKVLNTTLRFPDEFVRHKILDIIGDLYLLGRPIRGKVRASMTGHAENISLLKEISKEIG